MNVGWYLFLGTRTWNSIFRVCDRVFLRRPQFTSEQNKAMHSVGKQQVNLNKGWENLLIVITISTSETLSKPKETNKRRSVRDLIYGVCVFPCCSRYCQIGVRTELFSCILRTEVRRIVATGSYSLGDISYQGILHIYASHLSLSDLDSQINANFVLEAWILDVHRAFNF